MADVSESPSQSPIPVDETPSPPTPAKKVKSGKSTMPKKPSKPTKPATSELVLNAITTLKERNGSSLQAIKKFIASTYKIDMEKLAPFIKKYLKNAVGAGKLIQTKGKGASGSFKLPATPTKPTNEKNKKVFKKAKKTSEKKIKPEKPEKKNKEKLSALSKPLPETKNKPSIKKGTKNASASIKSTISKQKKPMKPLKVVASKVKAPKTKKAPSVKKAASGGAEKKAPKSAKSN